MDQTETVDRMKFIIITLQIRRMLKKFIIIMAVEITTIMHKNLISIVNQVDHLMHQVKDHQEVLDH